MKRVSLSAWGVAYAGGSLRLAYGQRVKSGGVPGSPPVGQTLCGCRLDILSTLRPACGANVSAEVSLCDFCSSHRRSGQTNLVAICNKVGSVRPGARVNRVSRSITLRLLQFDQALGGQTQSGQNVQSATAVRPGARVKPRLFSPSGLKRTRYVGHHGTLTAWGCMDGGAPVTAAGWPRAGVSQGFRSAVSKMLRKVLVNFAEVEVLKRRYDTLDQDTFLAVYHINQAAACSRYWPAKTSSVAAMFSARKRSG